MALIDINYEYRRAIIQFDNPLPLECYQAKELLFFAKSKRNEPVYIKIPVQYMELDIGNRFVPTTQPEKVLAFAMQDYGATRVGFLIDGQYQYHEIIAFTTQVIQRAIDPLRINTSYISLPKKPGRVAVFTQTYNEGDMLLYWEKYYASLVGYENLFVLDNASTDGSCARLNPKTSIIHMPVAPVDHEHFAQAQGYLQRFLLLKYDWVIKTDTDELITCEGDLVETLANTPPGIYMPPVAVEVVHDIKNEARFDFSGSVGSQRKHFVTGTKFLIRPVICSEHTTWTSGNHTSFEVPAKLPGFIVAHLKYFDQDFLLSKNKKWAAMSQTENETKNCKQISTLQELGLQEIYEWSEKEIADRMADEPIELPDWFAKKI